MKDEIVYDDTLSVQFRKRQTPPLVRSWFQIFRVYKQQPSDLVTQSILAQTAPRLH